VGKFSGADKLVGDVRRSRRRRPLVLERALMETAQVMSECDTDARGIPAPPAKVVAVTDQVASAADNMVPVPDEPRPRQPAGE
jgi:hypothetical protein